MVAATIFGNPQTSRFDLAQLQTFLKDYSKTIQQAQQAQNAEAVEQIQMIKKIWEITEKQLRDELLMNKYNMLFAMGFTSNPVAAKENFDERNVQKNVAVAALPYSTVADKDVQVTDEDLKAAYEQYKERFYTPVPTRDIKLIDVNVVAGVLTVLNSPRRLRLLKNSFAKVPTLTMLCAMLIQPCSTRTSPLASVLSARCLT